MKSVSGGWPRTTKDRGVAAVEIQPNDPKAIRIDELDSSDISDSLAEMKIRAEYKHLQYPYLLRWRHASGDLGR